jgi:hypothetical protein
MGKARFAREVLMVNYFKIEMPGTTLTYDADPFTASSAALAGIP